MEYFGFSDISAEKTIWKIALITRIKKRVLLVERYCLIFKKQWTNAWRDLINYEEYENERVDHYVGHCGCLDSPAGLYFT
jgi:hypothetical protein